MGNDSLVPHALAANLTEYCADILLKGMCGTWDGGSRRKGHDGDDTTRTVPNVIMPNKDSWH